MYLTRKLNIEKHSFVVDTNHLLFTLATVYCSFSVHWSAHTSLHKKESVQTYSQHQCTSSLSCSCLWGIMWVCTCCALHPLLPESCPAPLLWLAHVLLSSDMTPSSVNLVLATSSQPLLASGFLGDGCMMPSTCTLTCAADRARRARCSATRPTPITMETPSAFTASHSAVSHMLRRASRSAALSSGGVRFFPLAFMKISGHKLCTKQWRKNKAGSPHSFLNNPQKRAPLTSLWVQASPVIRRFGCSSWGWPTSPVIWSQSTTVLTSPKGTCTKKTQVQRQCSHNFRLCDIRNTNWCIIIASP